MAYCLIQAGTALQLMDTAGVLVTLTLPTNITLTPGRRPRWAIFGKYVVLVNSANRPITIDQDGIVRVLSPRPPTNQPILSAVAGGTLSGTYTVMQTFRIKDKYGNIIAESGYGPVSAPQVVTAQWLKAASLNLSADDVTSTQLYRNATLGAVYYPWVEIDGNTQTSVQDDLSDAGLSLIAAGSLGSCPDLTLVAEFKGRLFGVPRTATDRLRYSEVSKMWAWPVANDLLVPKYGSDSRGVTGLISRREALGIGRRNVLRQITGTGTTDFRIINLTENVGCESQETVQIYNDVAYFLWKDGVYEWGSAITCVSDGTGGKGNVRSWFATNSYFNRDEFDQAFAIIIPERSVYRLFLCSAGSTTIDRFVDFDLNERIWYGPHKTAAINPTCTLLRPTADDVLVPSVGSDSGYVLQEQITRTDHLSAIDLDVDTKRHDGQTPEIDKTWGAPLISTVALSGGRMLVTPSAGELEAPAALQAQQIDLTMSAQSVGRIGKGKAVSLNFRENSVGQDVKILGYEIPFNELGKRI